MDTIEKIIHGEISHILLSTVIFIISLVVVFLIYRFILNRLKKKARKSERKTAVFVADLLNVPLLWLMFWILLKIFSYYSFLSQIVFFDTLTKVNNILLILTIGWILIKVVNILFYYIQNKLDMNAPDNLKARKGLTKIKIFEGIIVAVISVVIIAVCLMTFDEVRTIGVSLLTSAGVAGIIVGFSAQKSLATILAGIQIAITQPIRLDDVVIVEEEWGRIEEITLTYVVVKIWDERRLILPVTYFIEKPFQNWTRSTSKILGTIFLYVDYKLPVEALRQQLLVFLDNHPQWDKRVANIQVTDTKDNYKELRILVSSNDASQNWDLRVDIREKMIDYINAEYPDCFVKTRISEFTSR